MTQTSFIRHRSHAVILLMTFMFAFLAFAQEGELDKSQPTGITPEEIIQKFAAKEKEFKEARDQYTYRQWVRVITPEDDGTYEQRFDVTFDDKGHRIKNVVFAPQPTLSKLIMTQEDLDDIENRLPFVLTSDELGEYDVLYIGQQQQDELHTYVFDVAPKQIEGKKRYFQGRIWVDDHDFQIVKTYGKTVPDIRKKKGQENLFPKYTTWREQIDGKYWFPTYTLAEDTLHFSATGDVKIKEVVKYEDYKRFGAKSRITYEGQDVSRGEPEKKPDEPKKPEEQKPQK